MKHAGTQAIEVHYKNHIHSKRYNSFLYSLIFSSLSYFSLVCIYSSFFSIFKPPTAQPDLNWPALAGRPVSWPMRHRDDEHRAWWSKRAPGRTNPRVCLVHHGSPSFPRIDGSKVRSKIVPNFGDDMIIAWRLQEHGRRQQQPRWCHSGQARPNRSTHGT